MLQQQHPILTLRAPPTESTRSRVPPPSSASTDNEAQPRSASSSSPSSSGMLMVFSTTHWTETIAALPLPGPSTTTNISSKSTSRKDEDDTAFDLIPVRRLDVLHPLTPSLIADAYLSTRRDELLPFALVTQFSPPSKLSAGQLKWSVLRFLILSSSSSSSSATPPQYFDVIASDIDVGTAGPFCSIAVNSNRTQCAVYSSLSSFCIVFKLPKTLPSNSDLYIRSRVLSLPGSSFDLLRWHPTNPNLLLLVSSCQNSSFFLFDLSSIPLVPTATASVDASIVDVDFLRGHRRLWDPIIQPPPSPATTAQELLSILYLTPTGSVFLVSLCALHKDVRRHRCRDKRLSSAPCVSLSESPKLVLPAPSIDADENQSLREYSSLVVIKDNYPLLLLFGRLDCRGSLEIYGTDMSSEEPPVLLDRLELHLSVGPHARMRMGQCRSYQSSGGCGSSMSSDWTATTDVGSPYAFVSTPEELFLVEFPWIQQLTSHQDFLSALLPSSSGVPAPSLIPSNAQLLYSTCDFTSAGNEEDALILGFSELPASPFSSISLLPRLIILRASLVPEKPHPDIHVPEAGWDICDVWDTVLLDLNGVLATNAVVQGYASDLKDFWDNWDNCDSHPIHAIRASSQPENNDTLRYCRALLNLGIFFNKNVGIPISALDMMQPSSRPVFTFRVDQGAPVDTILENLDLASYKLNLLNDFYGQLCGLQENLPELTALSKAQRVSETTRELQREACRLSKRVECLVSRNDQLLKRFTALLPVLLRMMDASRVESAEIVCSMNSYCEMRFVALSISQLIEDARETFSDRITSELLPDRTSAEALRRVLKPKVDMLMLELCEAVQQTSSLCLPPIRL